MGAAITTVKGVYSAVPIVTVYLRFINGRESSRLIDPEVLVGRSRITVVVVGCGQVAESDYGSEGKCQVRVLAMSSPGWAKASSSIRSTSDSPFCFASMPPRIAFARWGQHHPLLDFLDSHAGAHARGVIFFTRPGPGSGAREGMVIARTRAYWRYGSAHESH